MNPVPSSRTWVMLAVYILVALGAGAIGGRATASSVDTWYQTLAKPRWNPPDSVFAPVWTTLYLLMAIAGWRIWCRRDVPGAGMVLAGYFLQLILSTVWSLLFFGMRQPGAALLEVLVLWLTLVWLQVQLWRRDRVAGALWVPYLLWVSFATALNFAIWRLN